MDLLLQILIHGTKNSKDGLLKLILTHLGSQQKLLEKQIIVDADLRNTSF
jgi:hypothetical protein